MNYENSDILITQQMRVNVTNLAGACQISFNSVLKMVGHKLLLFNVV